MHRRHFLARTAAATAGGLVLPACDVFGGKDEESTPEIPLLAAPKPNENRFVGIYTGVVLLEDGQPVPFDLVAHGESRRPDIRFRIAPVRGDAHLGRGAYTTDAGDGEGAFEPRYGSFGASLAGPAEPGVAVSVDGFLPASGRGNRARLIVYRGAEVLRTLEGGYIARTSPVSTTDDRFLRALDRSPDCNAFAGPAEMTLVKTITKGKLGSRPTTITGYFEPTDRSQPNLLLFVEELSDTDPSFVQLGQVRVSRFDSYLYYYLPHPSGGLARGWVSERGILRLDLVDPATYRYTMHFENTRMRPFDGGAAGTFTLAFSGTCNAGEFTLNRG